MSEEIKAKWETILYKEEGEEWTQRLSVPGGWLYRVIVQSPEASVALAFVPFPAEQE